MRGHEPSYVGLGTVGFSRLYQGVRGNKILIPSRGSAADESSGELVEPGDLFRQGTFNLGVGTFAARDAADIGRVDTCLRRDPVVNPAVFRD